MSDEQKADEYFSEAEKLEKPGGFFTNIAARTRGLDYYQIYDLYQMAANIYKASQSWKKGALAFENAARIAETKNKDKLGTASMCVNAAQCYRKIDCEKAVKNYEKAKTIYIESGNLSTGARHVATIAEIYEKDMNLPAKALEYYRIAANFSKSDNMPVNANKYLAKVAELSAEFDKFHEAAVIFDEIGTICLDNNSLKFGTPTYFFKAGLCEICFDVLDGNTLLEFLATRDSNFKSSIHYKFLKEIGTAADERDIEAFTTAVQKYDKTLRFDEWTSRLILILKSRLTGEDDDR